MLTDNKLWDWFGFSPWVGKIPWRRAWQPTPVCLGIPWAEEPGGLQSIGLERGTTEASWHAHTHALLSVSVVVISEENDICRTMKPPGLLTEVSFCPSFHMLVITENSVPRWHCPWDRSQTFTRGGWVGQVPGHALTVVLACNWPWKLSGS